MLIRTEKKVILEAIAPCLCAITSRSANKALSCLYFQATQTDKGGSLTITTFDTTKGVKTTIDAEVLEEGELLLDAMKFHSMVRALPLEEVTVSSDINFVTTLSSGNAKFEILGMNSDSFPALPLLSGEKKMDIQEGTLKKMIQQVIFSCAVVDLKPILTGVLFEVKDDMVRLCGCDGYRIAIREEKGLKTASEPVKFIVPAKTLQELIRLLSDEEKPLHIELARRHIIFMFENFILFSRYIDGEYIDYQRSLPKEFKTAVTISLNDAIGCFERCSLLIDERAKAAIRLYIEEDSVRVQCTTANGKIDEELFCDVKGEPMLVGFNNKFLLDALKGAAACGVNEVLMQFSSPLSGMALRSTETDAFYYMVVPMRLN